MKKIFSLVVFIHLITTTASAQPCTLSFLGSKTLYKGENHFAPAPKGYVPVFINHAGRHGARHLTSDPGTSFIYTLLMKADSANTLTADGKLLKAKMLLLETVEKKNIKSISHEGVSEQQGLARRMCAANPTVFKVAKPAIDIDYSKEIRTLQTSDAFLDELKTKINEPVITRQINDITLRFYDLSPAYLEFKKEGSWMIAMQQLKTSLHYNELATAIAQHFFTPSFLSSLTEKDKDAFASGLFGFITIFYSIQKEIEEAGYKNADVDMQPFLDCEQLATLAGIDNAADFLLKGPGMDAGGIQVTIAVPLLADFIKTTDEYIQTKKLNAKLRFGHAETIAPFAALLSLEGASRPVSSIAGISHAWNAAAVIPLSANIQWILYQKKGAGGYLIKFLFNEKEVAVKGLITKTFPYYNWSDTRKFYLNKIQKLSTEESHRRKGG